MTFCEIAQSIGSLLLASMPKHWDGKQCIIQMKQSGNRQWKQMEWIGFYFQFRCEKHLDTIMKIPGPGMAVCVSTDFLKSHGISRRTP